MTGSLSDPGQRIAVILPCYNEAQSIARTVGDFRRALPTGTIYVIDNASTDTTAECAENAGATVIHEAALGKGNAVRRGFAEIDADIYLLVDGDGTYDADIAPDLIARMQRQALDMIVGARCETAETAFRPGHRFGNRMFNLIVAALFGRQFDDILSGYRVLSRGFVKSFPAMSQGFEIETELAVHALQLRLPTAEVPTRYSDRKEGSSSKLRTYRDGFKILSTILGLTRQNRPLLFYGVIAGLLAALSIGLGIPVITHYVETGLVPRLPTAILSTGIMILASLSLTSGLILHSIYHYQADTKRLFYLMAKKESERMTVAQTPGHLSEPKTPAQANFGE